MYLRVFVPLWLTLQLANWCAAADHPNFVWLISEDNSKHFLKLFDEHGAATDRIAQLADHGLIFRHAFSNAPVCSVARTTLMTGCYAPRIGTQFHRKSTIVPMPEGLRMFPAYLRDAGYYTTNNRKKDYNAIEGEGVWDESSGTATWRNRSGDQPFFHMQSFGTTHESSLHFARRLMKLPTDTDQSTVFIAPYHPDTPTFRYTYARYHDRIQQMDHQIGQVVDQLKSDGLLEDTFIFYFGDHGGVLPRGKGYAYESGLHVPLVVRVPDKWKHLVNADMGSRIDGFVSFIDFSATLLELAGVGLPKQIDGQPFLGKHVDTANLDRDEAFGYADRFDEKYDLVRTLRKGKYKYVRSYQPFNFDGLQNNYRYQMLAFAEWRELYRAGQLNAAQRQFFEARPAEALYDLEADPHEINDLATDPEHADIVANLRDRLTRRVKELPDLSFYPESYLVEHAFSNPVEFGQAHKAEIGELVDVANLNLVGFDKAKPAIKTALESGKPWVRYWGLMVCSSHGKAASEFIPRSKEIAAVDSELLVRVRAAEFLALIGAADPEDTIVKALVESESGVEQNLILNTLVLLKDGPTRSTFKLSRSMFDSAELYDGVQRRLDYLEVK